MKDEKNVGLTAENINENYNNFKEFWSSAAPRDNDDPLSEDIITKMQDELSPMLKESVCWVCFRKVSGEHRVMRCTLKEEMLPPNLFVLDEKKPKVKKASNPNVQNVYDLDIRRWRSFRWDSLVTYESEPQS